MSSKYRNKLILFLVLAAIACAIWPFEAFFAKGLLVGLLIAALIYILREFLPKRR
ncbi:hypothetical protein [Flavimarina sp. Hel_I_48]|uniref:hypothetical protein n=1 Tax=Flavimarina sp. Hel_I_48 TaxID=1392488 RepID=UPI0013DBD9B6|nr:hypothetical protein [Flavimarina sp. Hel_I_48]